jgi:hypothetical protein
MSTQVYLRVFGITGLGPDHIRRFPKGKVSLTAELANTKASTAQCSFGNGSIKLDQVREIILYCTQFQTLA